MHRLPTGFAVTYGDRTLAEEDMIDFSGLSAEGQAEVGWPEHSASMQGGLAVLRQRYNYDDVLDNARADALYKGFVQGFRAAQSLLMQADHPSWEVDVETDAAGRLRVSLVGK